MHFRRSCQIRTLIGLHLEISITLIASQIHSLYAFSMTLRYCETTSNRSVYFYIYWIVDDYTDMRQIFIVTYENLTCYS